MKMLVLSYSCLRRVVFAAGMPVVVAVAALNAGVARSQNLIGNGGFESGRTGFTTDYTYDTGGAIPGELFMEGTYNVVDDASRYHDGDPSIGFVGTPHTGSLCFAANGDTVANTTAWRSQLLTVGAGQTPYRFEVWMTSLRPVTNFPGIYTDAPALNLEIGDGQNWTTLGTTGTFANGTQAGLWFFRYADARFVQPGTTTCDSATPRSPRAATTSALTTCFSASASRLPQSARPPA